MFKVFKEKLYIPVAKNTIADVTISESFLNEFLQWANNYLLDKTKRYQFKQNLLRHIGPASTYTGRQNILKILHALYQFANHTEGYGRDLKSSIVSRIEERALNCTPGFETGLCDLAQTILCAPKSFDAMLQLVREDIIKKNAMIITDDVHGQNHVFRLAGPIFAVSLANDADPYTGQIALDQIIAGLNRNFEVFYHSIKLVDALREHFLTVIQGFGYVENLIDVSTHTKISEFIQTIFTQHPQVIDLKRAQSYLDAKNALQKNTFDMVLSLLASEGCFDLSQEQQEARFNDLLGQGLPDWLPESLHEELLNIRKIKSSTSRQHHLKVFFHQNFLFRVDSYLQNTKTKAAYEMANVPPSFINWAQSLPTKLTEHIKNLRQQTQTKIENLDKPEVTLYDAVTALDDEFWIRDEKYDFPLQRLNLDKIFRAFFHELKQRKAVETHALLDLVVFENSADFRIEIILRMIEYALKLHDIKFYIDMLAIINIYDAGADPQLKGALELFFLGIFNKTAQNKVVASLLHLCVDFKINLSFALLTHPTALHELQPPFFLRMLRSLQEKELALDYIETYYKVHSNASMRYHKFLLAIKPELRVVFLEKYAQFFILNVPDLIDVLKKLSHLERFSFLKLQQRFFHQISVDNLLSILDLLHKDDKFDFCAWIYPYLPHLFLSKEMNLSIIKQISLESRYTFIHFILGSHHPLFEELIAESFYLWKKKDKLSFLTESAALQKLNFEQFYKVILKVPDKSVNKQFILDRYLAQQTGNFHTLYFFKFEQLLHILDLNAESYLKHYAQFIIRNTFSYSSIYSRMLNTFNNDERYTFFSSLTPELKETLVQHQLLGETVSMLTPCQRMTYLDSFSRPYHELLHGEHNLVKTMESLTVQEQQILLLEMGLRVGFEIQTGEGFKKLVHVIKDGFSDETNCILACIRHYGIGLNISNGFFEYAVTWDMALRQKIFAELGSNVISILNTHYFPLIFSFEQDSEQQALMFKTLMPYISHVAPRDIFQFKQMLSVVNDGNMSLFLNFFVAYLAKNPIDFADFFDFIFDLSQSKQRLEFIGLLSKAHFLLDENRLDFCKLIRTIFMKLNRRLSSPLLILFKDDLNQFIKNSEDLHNILQSVSPKDQMLIIEMLGPNFSKMIIEAQTILNITRALANKKLCKVFFQHAQTQIFTMVTKITDACYLAKQVELEEQLSFLGCFEFSKEELIMFDATNEPDILIRAYLSICQAQECLDGSSFFQLNYKNLLEDIRTILCEPQRFSTDKIMAKIRELPFNLSGLFEDEVVHHYLMNRESEFNQGKRFKHG